MLLLVLTALAAAPSCPTFVFHGQPECVELVFSDGVTVMTHDCEHPVWVDQSVRLPDDPAGPVRAGTTTTLRDLSTFTMGMGGELFRVVAAIDTSCDPGDSGDSGDAGDTSDTGD